MSQSPRNALALARTDGFTSGRKIIPRFHFDRGEDAATPDDEIHLAHGRAVAPRQDAIALEAQLPKTEQLGARAAPVGRTPARFTKARGAHATRPARKSAR